MADSQENKQKEQNDVSEKKFMINDYIKYKGEQDYEEMDLYSMRICI